MKLTAHLQLVSRSRKCGSVHALPYTPSWHTAELIKHRDNFTLQPTYVLVVFVAVSFLLAFPAISYMHSSSPPIRATYPANLILLEFIKQHSLALYSTSLSTSRQLTTKRGHCYISVSKYSHILFQLPKI
jgi:hypothetical protein